MRTNLKILRTRSNLTQREMAAVLGFTRQTYADVENGKREGSSKFWNRVFDKFGIPDEEMQSLMRDFEVQEMITDEGK